MSNNTEFIFRGTSLFYPWEWFSVDLSKFYSSGDFFWNFFVWETKKWISDRPKNVVFLQHYISVNQKNKTFMYMGGKNRPIENINHDSVLKIGKLSILYKVLLQTAYSVDL